MKNKKKIVFAFIITILVLFTGFLAYKIVTKEKENLELTKSEKQWINSNKNQLIDMAILNKIPVVNYSGTGIFFDYINYVEKQTGLEFNKIPYTASSNIESSYALRLSKENKSDILIYEDNYVLASQDNIKYNSLEELNNLKLAVLTEDENLIKSYIPNSTIKYVDCENIEELLELVSGTSKEKEIDALVIPKVTYLNYILDKNFTISYNMNEFKIYYYLSLGDDKVLNSILTKYYKKWYKDNYIKSYNTHLFNSYFTFSKNDKNALSSKRYKYGYLENLPYDKLKEDKYIGFNSNLINDFASFANIEIIYNKYNNVDELVKDYNDNKIDIIFDYYDSNLYKEESISSINLYDSTTVVLSHLENPNCFNSIKSLRNQNVLVISNTKINEYLKNDDYNIIAYDNINKLIDDLHKDDVIVIDKELYLKNIDQFDQFKIDFIFNMDKYGFKLNDNEAFNKIFDFYLSYNSLNTLKQNGYINLYKDSKEFKISKELIILIVVIILLLIFTILVKFKPKDKKVKALYLKRNDKLKYIDMLTSLKNRNYLNDNIEYWDSSEVYPQAIIIVDLNNVSYINDNYGHEAGDEVITQAANILITNQLPKTEIIRTSGNEFLIYLVEYDEKQVVSYIRKLNKEFKELTYGFGAAIGYSMILEGIKTIDDAVNEATINMRTIKEESNNHE